MPYLVAAAIVLGIVNLVNLLVATGILGRLRKKAVRRPEPRFALGPGSAVGEFSATTTAGEPVSKDTLAGMVGFFSAGCEACHELLPVFVKRARDVGREKTLAVVGSADDETVAALAAVARVVTAGQDGGPVARAFQNTRTPALYLIDDEHRVIAVGARLDELPLRHLVGVQR